MKVDGKIMDIQRFRDVPERETFIFEGELFLKLKESDYSDADGCVPNVVNLTRSELDVFTSNPEVIYTPDLIITRNTEE